MAAGCGASSSESARLTQGSLTVEAPVSGGHIVATPADQQHLPTWTASRVMAPPVRLDVDGGALSGPAKITFEYDANSVAEPSDLFIATFVPQLGLWLPVEASVDTAHHLVTTSTPHLSEWVLGVNDVGRSEFDKTLESTTGGKLASLIAGKRPELTCPTDKARLTSSVKDLDPPVSVCLFQQAEGFQMQIGDTHGYPLRFHLPSGVRAEDETSPELFTAIYQNYIRARDPEHPLLIAPEDKGTLEYTPESLRESDPVTGEVDWGAFAWDLEIAVAKIVLGANVKESDTKEAREFFLSSSRTPSASMNQRRS